MALLSTIDSLAKMTAIALEIWQSKEKNKYKEKYFEIKKRLEIENRKPTIEQDFNLIDHLNRDLILFAGQLGEAITASRDENPKTKSPQSSI